MEAQSDFEREPVLAVFRLPAEARSAAARLQEVGVPGGAVSTCELAPGRYQVEDGTAAADVAGAVRGVLLGAPLGTVAGLTSAVVTGASNAAHFAGLMAAGFGGGLVAGGLIGAISRTLFDDDEAAWVDVPAAGPYQLLAVEIPSSFGGRHQRVCQTLRQAGAIAFLDPSLPEADALLELAHAPAGRLAV